MTVETLTFEQLVERFDALEARMTELEAWRSRTDRSVPPPSRPAVVFGGFRPGETVELTIGGPDGGMEAPACPSVTADAAGRASFLLEHISLEPKPPPETRVYRARSSTREVERPV